MIRCPCYNLRTEYQLQLRRCQVEDVDFRIQSENSSRHPNLLNAILRLSGNGASGHHGELTCRVSVVVGQLLQAPGTLNRDRLR